MITLTITDDHAGVRQSLAECLERHGNCKVLLDVGSGEELFDGLKTLPALPDICLVDLQMPEMNGFEVLQRLRRQYPSVKVIVYSTFLEELNILKSYKYGACAAFPKELGLKELIDVIKDVYNHGLYIPVYADKATQEAIATHQISIPHLTEREIEFIKLCCRNLSNKEIANLMHINTKTVDRYRDNVCQKLNVKGRHGIALFAFKTGIVDLQ